MPDRDPRIQQCAKCGAFGANNMTINGMLCDKCLETNPKVCDFCSDKNPLWVFPAKGFTTTYGYDSHSQIKGRSDKWWAACQPCHDLVLANDNNGLADRALASEFAAREYRSGHDRAVVRQLIVEGHGKFMNNRTGAPITMAAADAILAAHKQPDREPLPESIPYKPEGHAQYMAALETRLRWIRWARSPKAVERWGNYGLDKLQGRYLQTLEHGPTYYMDQHFCELVDHARRLNEAMDLTFSTQWMLSQQGWLYLARPFTVPDLEFAEDLVNHPMRDIPMMVGAIGWQYIEYEAQYAFACFVDLERQPYFQGTRRTKDRVEGYWVPKEGFSSWSYFTLKDGQRLRPRIDSFEKTTDWNFGHDINRAGIRVNPVRNVDPLHEIRWLYVALQLMSQRLTARVRHQPDRHTRRRIEREKQIAPPFIEVVTLRRKEVDRQEETKGKRDVDWQWQWTVQGHWRKQWYGAEGVHKPVLIDAYVKGPKDKPLKPPSTKIFRAVR